MARPKPTDYDICANPTCTHTVNSHSQNGEVGVCGAYLCQCSEFVKKNS